MTVRRGCCGLPHLRIAMRGTPGFPGAQMRGTWGTHFSWWNLRLSHPGRRLNHVMSPLPVTCPELEDLYSGIVLEARSDAAGEEDEDPSRCEYCKGTQDVKPNLPRRLFYSWSATKTSHKHDISENEYRRTRQQECLETCSVGKGVKSNNDPRPASQAR
jgi:hypothetical protein